MNEPTLSPGQVWVSTQRRHVGWEVEIRKIGSSHIQADVLRPSTGHGKKVNYGMGQFVRDFEYLRGGEEPSNGTEPSNGVAVLDPETREQDATPAEVRKRCAHCKAYLPLDAFGVNRTRPDGKQTTCRTCNNAAAAARNARIRAARLAANAANGIAEVPRTPKARAPSRAAPRVRPAEPKPATRPTAGNADAKSLAAELMEFAIRVEDLGTPKEYKTLVSCVRDVLFDGTDAFDVFVVPAHTIKALLNAYVSVKGEAALIREDVVDRSEGETV